jgi:uncharacterized protein YbjQ (UPF0145 family)
MPSCEVCKTNVGSIFGTRQVDLGEIKKIKDAGIDIPDVLCYKCYTPYFEKLNMLKGEEENIVKNIVDKIIVCTILPYSYNEYEIIGIVSAYIALGTGPFNQILSSVTDFFGVQSESYNAKMTEAESACITKLKMKAAKSGATAVVGVQTTFTELTHGHGILLLSMSGTAIRYCGREGRAV